MLLPLSGPMHSQTRSGCLPPAAHTQDRPPAAQLTLVQRCKVVSLGLKTRVTWIPYLDLLLCNPLLLGRRCTSWLSRIIRCNRSWWGRTVRKRRLASHVVVLQHWVVVLDLCHEVNGNLRINTALNRNAILRSSEATTRLLDSN